VVIKNQVDFEDQVDRLTQIPKELAILPINDAVVFPLMTVPLLLNDPKLLRLADEALARLRLYLRLAARWGWLSGGQYQHASTMTVEIGRLLGGWQKVTVRSAGAAGDD